MHYSFSIARNGLNPSLVPAIADVDITWIHRDRKGHMDVIASRRAANDMVVGYGIVCAPALHSRHTEGNAIDMDISWAGDLTIKTHDGTKTIIKTFPRTGRNTQLAIVGRGYGVYKLVTDPPHWSSDGH